MKDKQFEMFMSMAGRKAKIAEDKVDVKDAPAVVKDKEQKDDAKHGLKGVAGMKELKAQVKRDFIDILNNKALADAYEITPTPMMLYGAPGTGKTFFVKKLAEELKMNFMTVVPDDIASIYVHGTQEKIAGIFKKAVSKAPTLLFLDEFDSMVPHRQQAGSQQNNQSGEVAEFLTQMNDLAEKGVYVVTATNHPEAIDRAVLRSGRIDQMVYVPLPDDDAREELFRLELSNRPKDSNIDFKALAKKTSNYTASDITSIVRTAARMTFEAARNTETKEVVPITQGTIESVIEKKPSSVSERDIRFYENLRKEFSPRESDKKKTVGFGVN